MQHIFSAEYKYQTWRTLWVALAKVQQKAGLPITTAQITEMEDAVTDINFDKVAAYEKESRHEVMAHIKAFGECAPSAKPIIHLGATSVFVMDNGELLQIHKATTLIQHRIQAVIHRLMQLAQKYARTPTLAYTHLQPAQPTSIGKRCAQWGASFCRDLQEIHAFQDALRLRGIKGATGTQASFAQMGISWTALQDMETDFAQLFGFKDCYPIVGQCYDRKIDHALLSALANIAISAHKCATDIRLLQGLGEMEEVFEKQQVGSSAMPYKRNPILSERVCSIAKFLMALPQSSAAVASTQWLEHSLDDSAARRIHIAQSFLAADAILILLSHITRTLHIKEERINANIHAQLPFLLSEKILVAHVRAGGDRQEIHERIRIHAMDAVEKHATDSDYFLRRIEADPAITITREELTRAINDGLIGYAAEQTERWIADECTPLLHGFSNDASESIRV